MTALLTLVVTAHRVQYLQEALDSVSGQTGRTFDLVLVSDSLGESGVSELFERFRATWDGDCRVLSASGGSAGPVRNAGFAASRSEWVTYLDGDDVLAPEARRAPELDAVAVA